MINYAAENIKLLELYNLTYNDILLMPQKGVLNSRSEALIDNFKVFTAPMDTILDETHEGIQHPNLVKLLPRESTKQFIRKNMMRYNIFPEAELPNFIFCFGTSDSDFDNISRLLDKRIPVGICIDVAHGHTDSCLNIISKLRESGYEGDIMSGSVATEQGAYDSIQAGANLIRVGIGGGQMCTTRLITGCGVPNVTSIYNAYLARHYNSQKKNVKIIADGGIKYPGDIVKALAVGADYVMIGTGFSNCINSAAKVIDGKKIQRGQASEEYQIEYLGKVRNGAAEGVTRYLNIDERTIEQKLEFYLGGLRSAISYLGLQSSNEINIKNVKLLKCESTVMLENNPMEL